MEKGLTSIIILTYNQLKFTKICLNSIKQYTNPSYELIMVDNGSTDGTADYLRQMSTEYLILNQSNLGYARGVNQGLKKASGEYLLLLNNDTIVSWNWLDNLLRCLKSSTEIGIVGPRTNYAGGKQGGVRGDFNKSFSHVHNFSKRFNQSAPAKWFEVDLIVGFCMLFKRGVLQEVGYFDEGFSYGMFEDNDFCQRAREKGFKLFCAGDTFVFHFGSRSFVGNKLNMVEIYDKNKKRFEDKWGE